MVCPSRVIRFQSVVEAGGDFRVFSRHTGFLLDKAGKDDHIVHCGSLLADCIPQIRGFGVKGAVESIDVVINRIVKVELIGVREQIALTLHQASLCIGDFVPEGILAKVRTVLTIGTGKEFIRSAQTIFLHQLCNSYSRVAFREGDLNGLAFHFLGRKFVQDVIIGHAGAKVKIPILQSVALTTVLGIKFEQPIIFNDSLILQYLTDGCH